MLWPVNFYASDHEGDQLKSRVHSPGPTQPKGIKSTQREIRGQHLHGVKFQK